MQNLLLDGVTYKLILAAVYIGICFFSIKIINFLAVYFEGKVILSTSVKQIVNSAVILSLKTPLTVSYWLLCFYKVFLLFNENFVFYIQAKVLLTASLSVWIVLNFIQRYEEKYIEAKLTEKAEIDYGKIGFLKKLFQILTFIIILIVTIEKLGLKLHSIMAIGGIGGLAIGFAAKETLANIFGGLVLHFDKPFTIDELISSYDKKIDGRVKEIGWRHTKVLSFSQTVFNIPNSVFLNIIVENKSRTKLRKIEETVPIKHTDPKVIVKMTDEIKCMLAKRDDIETEENVVACLDTIQPNGVLNIYVSAFVKTRSWIIFVETKQEILLKVIDIIRANGSDLAQSLTIADFKKQI